MDTVTPWLRPQGNDVLLTLHVRPGAKATDVAGTHGDALKIRLAAPPRNGKANKALIAFLAKRIGVPRTAVELINGHASRTKRVRIRGATPPTVLTGLGASTCVRSDSSRDLYPPNH